MDPVKKKKLKPNAVPHIFPWKEQSECCRERSARSKRRAEATCSTIEESKEECPDIGEEVEIVDIEEGNSKT